jgi:hypothetical protein
MFVRRLRSGEQEKCLRFSGKGAPQNDLSWRITKRLASEGKKSEGDLCRLAFIVFQQAAESFVTNDLAIGGRTVSNNLQWRIAKRLMWPFFQIMSQVVVDNVPKVIFAQDNEMVQTFLAYRQDPAFAERVQVRRRRADFLCFNSLGLHDRVELLGEFGVKIVQQVGGLVGFVAGENMEVPGKDVRTEWH